MTVSMAACGKSPKKSPEQPKEKKYPYGFRCYYSEPPHEHILIEEYENRVNRVTETKYYSFSGEVSSKTEWIYDDDGEILLKKVEDSDYSSTTEEYDQKGRRIRSVRSYFGEYADSLRYINITIQDYDMANSKLRELMYYFFLRAETTELRTEFTYEGDSEIPSSIKSFSKEGDEVMHMDLGEHGEVTYAFYEDAEHRYEETYDAAERKGTWKWYDRFVLSGEPERLLESGENYYDESGRKLRWLSYSYVSDGNADLYAETTFSYDSDGYVVADKSFRDEGKVSVDRTRQYDAEDRLLKDSYHDYDDNGEYYSAANITNTYHDNGQLASTATERWDPTAKKFVPEKEEEYNEDGEQTVERTYINGQIEHEKIVSFLEEEGIAGPVKAEMNMNYEDGKCTSKAEVYYVQIKDPYGDVDWFEYRTMTTNKWGRTKETTSYQVTFDESGRLIQAANPADGYYIEFDLQGRVIKEVMYDGTDYRHVTEYEYWDENPESGQANAS